MTPGGRGQIQDSDPGMAHHITMFSITVFKVTKLLKGKGFKKGLRMPRTSFAYFPFSPTKKLTNKSGLQNTYDTGLQLIRILLMSFLVKAFFVLQSNF